MTVSLSLSLYFFFLSAFLSYAFAWIHSAQNPLPQVTTEVSCTLYLCSHCTCTCICCCCCCFVSKRIPFAALLFFASAYCNARQFHSHPNVIFSSLSALLFLSIHTNFNILVNSTNSLSLSFPLSLASTLSSSLTSLSASLQSAWLVGGQMYLFTNASTSHTLHFVHLCSLPHRSCYFLSLSARCSIQLCEKMKRKVKCTKLHSLRKTRRPEKERRRKWNRDSTQHEMAWVLKSKVNFTRFSLFQKQPAEQSRTEKAKKRRAE